MANCPQCHSEVEIPQSSFGTLFNCPLCQAVYFVGWDGVPEGELKSPEPAISLPPTAQDENSISSSGIDANSIPNFQDVVDFGNSPQPLGTLTYTVFVEGIEIADTRNKFKEAITDSRYGWDVDLMMGQIINGAITFADLSPAKATVLVNRIKYLPIQVKWKQNLLS